MAPSASVGRYELVAVNGGVAGSVEGVTGDLLLDPDGRYVLGVVGLGQETGRWARVAGREGRLHLVRDDGPAALDTTTRRLDLFADSVVLRRPREFARDTLVFTLRRPAANAPTLPDGAWVLVTRNGRDATRPDTVSGPGTWNGRPVVFFTSEEVAHDTIVVRAGLLARRSYRWTRRIGVVGEPSSVSTESRELNAFWGRFRVVRADSVVWVPYTSSAFGVATEGYTTSANRDSLVRRAWLGTGYADVLRRAR